MTSPTLLAASTLSDAGLKLFNSFGTVLTFLAIVLVVFWAAGRAAGWFYRPVAILVFLGPAIALLLLGLVFPAILTFYLSLKNSESNQFIGADNYTWAFTNSNIQSILITTLLWLLIAPVVTTLLGLALALLVDKLKLQAVYKSFIFM